MPKKKRTRKQKLQSDVRKVTTVSSETVITTPKRSEKKKEETKQESSSGTSYSLSAKAAEKKISQPKSTKTTVLTSGYGYLVADLRKTLILTGAIVLVQLALYFYI